MTTRITTLFLTFFLLFVSGSTVVASDMSATPSAAAIHIEYTLPYPGLLPDNPFYPLKMARDRIVSMLISDPLKRAEFDLLQADKRIQGGVYLINKDAKKANLALSTISKGQQYLQKAITDDEAAKKQGHNTRLFTEKLFLASRKHREVLHSIGVRIPQAEKKYYELLLREQDALIGKAKILSDKDRLKK